MARLTGLEPATPGVTGRYSNQLSYNRAWSWWIRGGLQAVKQDFGARLQIAPLGKSLEHRYGDDISCPGETLRAERIFHQTWPTTNTLPYREVDGATNFGYGWRG